MLSAVEDVVEEQKEDPLVVKVELRQCRNVPSKRRELFVLARVGMDEIYRSKSLKRSRDMSWPPGTEVFGRARYIADEDGPLFLEVCGPTGNVLARCLVPLNGENTRKSVIEQPTVWVPLAGSKEIQGSELGLGVLAVKPLLEDTMPYVCDKRGMGNVRAVLVQDEILLFDDDDEGKYRRSIILGTRAKVDLPATVTALLRIVDESGSEHCFTAGDHHRAAEWRNLVRAYAGEPFYKTFGVPLKQLIKSDRKLPAFLSEIIDFVRENGLKEEGIFRLTVPQSELSGAVRRAEVGVNVMEKTDSPHMAASMLKRFLRMLPESLLTDELEDKFLQTSVATVEESVATLKDLVSQLPPENRVVLESVMHLAYDVHCNRDKNLMGCENLGVVFGPVLINNQNSNPLSTLDSTSLSVQVATVMISRFPDIFPATKPASPPPTSLPHTVVKQLGQPTSEPSSPVSPVVQLASPTQPMVRFNVQPRAGSEPQMIIGLRQAASLTTSHAEVLLPSTKPVFPNAAAEQAEMTKYAELIFNKYKTGGTGFMCEAGFCCFLEHISVLEGFRVFNHDFSVGLFSSLAPQRQLDFNTFAEWLVNNYRTLYAS